MQASRFWGQVLAFSIAMTSAWWHLCCVHTAVVGTSFHRCHWLQYLLLGSSQLQGDSESEEEEEEVESEQGSDSEDVEDHGNGDVESKTAI